MLEFPLLAGALQNTPVHQENRIWYRRVAFDHLADASKGIDPLYFLGSNKEGQRFTEKNGAPGLYAAADEITAIAETKAAQAAVFSTLPGSQIPADPMVTFQLEVFLLHILDIRDPLVMQALQTDRAELQAEWRFAAPNERIPTWDLAHAVHASDRYSAIKYESRHSPGQACLVIFPDRLLPGKERVRVIDSTGKLQRVLP